MIAAAYRAACAYLRRLRAWVSGWWLNGMPPPKCWGIFPNESGGRYWRELEPHETIVHHYPSHPLPPHARAPTKTTICESLHEHMAKPALSPWFPMSQLPWEPGIYQLDLGDCSMPLARFHLGEWWSQNLRLRFAERPVRKAFQWRGLASPPTNHHQEKAP